jgi:hypothetical protein
MLSGDSISVHTEIGSENRVDFPPKGVLVTGLIAFEATLITYRYMGMMSSSDDSKVDLYLLAPKHYGIVSDFL